MSRPFLKVAAGLIQNSAGLWLIAQRPSSKQLGGHWEFPGGKIRGHEPPADALRREIKEELGVEIQVAETLLESDYVYPFARIHFYFIRAHILGGKPRALEHQCIKWVAAQDLKHYKWSPADLPAVDLLTQSPRSLDI